MDKPRRLAHLDGLRGLAALFVVLHHVWLTVWPFEYGAAPTGPARALDVLAYGHFAVGVFIVLSGFCLLRPVVEHGALRGGALRFFRRRARRILPPYYAALALSLLLATTLVAQHTGTHWDISIPVTASGVIGNALLVQDVFGAPQVNHVFWSIAVECWIYLLFPLLVALWLRRGAAVATGAAAATSAALCSLVAIVPVLGPVRLVGATPQYLFLFALGMLAAHVCFSPRSRGLRDRAPWTALFVAASVALVGSGYLLGRAGTLGHFPELDALVGVAAAALLVATTRPRTSRLRALLASRRIAALGAFAYSVYLVHAPLVQLVWQTALRPFALPDGVTFALLAGGGVPLVLAAAYAFFLCCERPFLTPRRRPVPQPAIAAASSARIEGSATSAWASASSSGG